MCVLTVNSQLNSLTKPILGEEEGSFVVVFFVVLYFLFIFRFFFASFLFLFSFVVFSFRFVFVSL